MISIISMEMEKDVGLLFSGLGEAVQNLTVALNNLEKIVQGPSHKKVCKLQMKHDRK